MTETTERHAWDGHGPVRKLLVPSRKQIDAEARTIDFVVSTGAKDRDGDVVDPGGWDVSAYLKNPVVLWAHDSRQPPVAKALSMSADGSSLRAVAQFPDRETYAFGDTVFRLYEGGYLSAVSAGFMPKELEPVVDDSSGWIDGFRITSQELWEFSAVPIPSNPEALVSARSKGLDVRPCLDWIEAALDHGEGRDGELLKLLGASYIHLKGRVHPVVQAELAKRNAVAARRKVEGGIDPSSDGGDMPEAKAAPGDRFTTTPAEDDGHAHEFEMGAAQTEPGGEGEHMHGITYDKDGRAVIEDAEGHGHEAPEGAVMEPEENGARGEKKGRAAKAKAALGELSLGDFVRVQMNPHFIEYGVVVDELSERVLAILPVVDFDGDGNWDLESSRIMLVLMGDAEAIEPLPMSDGVDIPSTLKGAISVLTRSAVDVTSERAEFREFKAGLLHSSCVECRQGETALPVQEFTAADANGVRTLRTLAPPRADGGDIVLTVGGVAWTYDVRGVEPGPITLDDPVVFETRVAIKAKLEPTHPAAPPAPKAPEAVSDEQLQRMVLQSLSKALAKARGRVSLSE